MLVQKDPTMFKYGLILIVLFVFTNVHYSKGQQDDETTGDATDIELPEGHPQNCKFLYKGGTGMHILGVLPGIGWDNLRNVFMDMVVNYQYKTCTFTEDEKYLIPDGMFTIPIKESKIDISAEVFKNWTDYRSGKSASINAQASYSGIVKSVSGSFSAEVQANKQRQTQGKSMTTRVELRHRLYKVVMGARVSLSKEFKTRVIQIGNYLANGDSKMAAYLGDILVRDYGTHVLTRVDAGGIIIQESQIKNENVENMMDDAVDIKASATASFLRGKISASFSANAHSDRASSNRFENKFTDIHIESYGGPVYKSNMNVNEWEDGIGENLVAIDKAGEPLHTIITNGYIGELPPFLVRQVSLTVRMAIYRYYEMNIIEGCTNSESTNFNFLANTGQNILCTNGTTGSKFQFGGAFSKCTTRVSASKVCDGKIKQNPFTGARTCPTGFNQILVSTEAISKGYYVSKEEEQCTKSGWLRKKKCKTVTVPDRKIASAQIDSYWCASEKLTEKDYYFGGIYSKPKVPNPITGTVSCPQHFMSLSLGNGVSICASDDDRAIPKVKFGGIFTCRIGNPFLKGASNMKECPEGYLSYLATVTDNTCRFSYCMRGSIQRPDIPTTQLPIRPPYIDRPEPSANATNTMAFMDDLSGDVWMKDEGTGEWAKYGMKDEMPAVPGLLVDSDQTDSAVSKTIPQHKGTFIIALVLMIVYT